MVFYLKVFNLVIEIYGKDMRGLESERFRLKPSLDIDV